LDNWQTIAKQLADYFNVYIIDQRNHGRSPHVEGIDYQLLAEDLCIFMQNNGMYKAHLMGHSMGGKTVMQFAMNYPDMVEKLAVIDIAPKTYKGGHETIIETLQSIDLTQLKDRKDAENQMLENIPEFGQRQFLLKNLSRDEQTGNYEWKMNLSEIVKNYDKILANIDTTDVFEGETIFIRGEQSNYILDSDVPTLKQFFPNSTLQTIANAGHWVHAEQPKALLEEVMKFFL
jgi:pimeloyl-ACP methyl ester carboxylesterase